MVEIVRRLYLLSHLFIVLQIELVEVLGDGSVGVAVSAEISGRNTLADFYGNLTSGSRSTALWHDVSAAVNIHGQNVSTNLLCNMEGTLVETHDAVVCPDAFREYHHVVSLSHRLADFIRQHVQWLLNAHEARQFEQVVDNGIPPYLLAHDAQDVGIDSQYIYRVKHRHVVADDDAATTEVFIVAVADDRLYTPDVVDVSQHGLMNHAVEPGFARLLVPGQQSCDPAEQTAVAQLEQVDHCRIPRSDELFDGYRHVAPMAVGIDNPVEDQWWHHPCHEHHCQHTYNSYLCQRMQGRMLGNNQRTDADKHNQCRDDDAVLERWQQLLLIGIFVDETVGDEDGVVVALSEDKGGQNDVDDVELHVEQTHDAQNPYPSQCHRQECQQCQFQSAERQP